MTPPPSEHEVEDTVTVTVKVPRRHVLAIRGITDAGDVESTMDLISSTSCAVVKAVKALPDGALETAFSCTSRPTKFKANIAEIAASNDIPEVQSMGEDHEFPLVASYSDPSSRAELPSPEDLTYRRHDPKFGYLKLLVRSSTTAREFADLAARLLGCSVDRQIVCFEDMLL